MFPQSMEQLRRRDRRKIFEKRRKIFEKKRSKPVRTKNLKFDGFRRIFLGIRRISTDFDGFPRPGPDQIFCFRNRSGSDFFAPGTGPDQFFCFRNRFGLDFLVTEPTRCSSDAKKTIRYSFGQYRSSQNTKCTVQHGFSASWNSLTLYRTGSDHLNSRQEAVYVLHAACWQQTS